ncbi:MAG: hypothetical protein ABSC18_09900 [Verrucomicrobiota bacterium]
MNEPALCFFLAILGSVAGAFLRRVRASGVVALLLPVAPGAALWMATGAS